MNGNTCPIRCDPKSVINVVNSAGKELSPREKKSTCDYSKQKPWSLRDLKGQ